MTLSSHTNSINKKSPIKQAVIITDCTDIAFNEMHQSLLNEFTNLGIHDFHIAPSVSVKNFSVVNAAFSIRLLADIFPSETTIFIVVVHGIHSNPERIFGQTNNGLTFVGNNSGYFDWLIKDFGLDYIYENKTNRDVNGKSFGGKYVQIPTAAKIINGNTLEEMGIRKSKDFLKDFPIVDGTVVHIDNFGLIKIKAPKLKEYVEGDKLKIYLDGSYKLTAVYTEKMKKQADGTWTLYTGSSLYGLPELGRVRSQNSAKELEIVEGQVITWEKID